MRVRITAVMKGRIDGINLEQFEVGHVYDIGTSLVNYLLASGYAVPVDDERPAPIVPDGRPPAPKDRACDKSERPRKRR
jgi:hypothetical protein